MALRGTLGVRGAPRLREWFIPWIRADQTHAMTAWRDGNGPRRAAQLSPEARRGLKLFAGRASCIDCHDTPLFSDQQFHNIGVAQAGEGVPTVADCLRPETMSAIIDRKEKAAVARLIEMAQAGDINAIATLSFIRDPRSIQVLKNYADTHDGNSSVYGLAVNALKAMSVLP